MEVVKTHSDLLSLALFASLHDSHQVGMLPLLLCLRAATGRVGDIDAVLGHNREPGESELRRLLDLLPRRLLGNPRVA